MRGTRPLLFPWVFVVVLAVGCDLSNSPLEGAVHPILVYPGATVVAAQREDAMDEWGKERTTSITWTLKTDDAMVEVVDFYKPKLPQAKVTEGDGVVTFDYLPERAVANERIAIEIRPGEIKITEVVPEEKRP